MLYEGLDVLCEELGVLLRDWVCYVRVGELI